MTSPSFSDVSLRTFQMQICIMLARLFILGSTLRKDAKNNPRCFKYLQKAKYFRYLILARKYNASGYIQTLMPAVADIFLHLPRVGCKRIIRIFLARMDKRKRHQIIPFSTLVTF
jgi:hypothetical protein